MGVPGSSSPTPSSGSGSGSGPIGDVSGNPPLSHDKDPQDLLKSHLKEQIKDELPSGSKDPGFPAPAAVPVPAQAMASERPRSNSKLSGTMNRFKCMLLPQGQAQVQSQSQQPSATSKSPVKNAQPGQGHVTYTNQPPAQFATSSGKNTSQVSLIAPKGSVNGSNAATDSHESVPANGVNGSGQGPRSTGANTVSNNLSATISNQSITSATSSTNGGRRSVTSMGSAATASAKDGNLPRFQLSEDGSTHWHHLKHSKRQEKLSAMFRDLLRFGGGSAHPSVIETSPQQQLLLQQEQQQHQQQQQNSDQPPSLMATFLNQLHKGESEETLLNQVLHNSSRENQFVEKYGKCHEVIGRGSYGVVRISHKTDPKLQKQQWFAVKEVKKRSTESESEYSKRLTSEFCISSSLHHANIIKTLDLLKDDKGEYCEVMEFCHGGDLYSLILATGKLEYLEADCFFKQVVRGVNYMHEMGVAHRDLKPENILLTVDGCVKITDFGNGECFRMAWEKAVHFSSGVCGSEPYIAPEEFNDEPFDPRAVDIWAVGVIYMAMRTGRHLWRIAKASEDHFYRSYLEGRKDENGYEPIESLKRARCRNVIYSILDPVPSRRITGKQILKSEWGREIIVCEAGEHGI